MHKSFESSTAEIQNEVGLKLFWEKVSDQLQPKLYSLYKMLHCFLRTRSCEGWFVSRSHLGAGSGLQELYKSALL